MASYYYPSVIALVEGILSGEIEPIEISGKFVLRNPYPAEMIKVNSIIKDEFNSLPELRPDHCLLEINESIPNAETSETWLEYHHNIQVYGQKLILRALTFLRLCQFGHLGFVYLFVPGANIENCAYSFLDTRFQTPPKWQYYTCPYDFPENFPELESFVGQFWNQKIEEDNVVRWFNKSFLEPHLEDKLTDLIFALEQLYLRKESERVYLSYKLAMRCAFLLAKNREERMHVFENVRNGYKNRSKVVHEGKRLESDEETMRLIIELEGYLRKSILVYLKDNIIFNSKNLDNLILSAGCLGGDS